jgi:uncharacterized cupin superfamily protein
MIPLLQQLTKSTLAPTTEAVAPEKLISGAPVHTVWSAEENDGLYCGIWQSTPGKWRISYDEWEYFRLTEGVSVITDAEGTATTLQAGDAWLLRPGFSGTWEVLETTVKDYVILIR